jgi:hypothetical protein
MTTSWKWRLAGFTAVVVTAFLSAATWAATYSTNSFSDAFVTTGPGGNLAGNNYGAAGALGVSASNLPNGEFQSALQFDTSGARNSFDNQFGSGQWTVQSVSLQLTATPPNNAIFNATGAGQFQIYWMQNDSWTEGTGTPNTPTTTGITFTSLQNTFIGPGDESLGTFSFDGATSGTANYTLNLTPGFTADLAAGNDLSLRLVAADTGVSYLFDSRNFGTAASRPSLSIDAVPEPGTLALGGLGITLLAGWRIAVRRRIA